MRVLVVTSAWPSSRQPLEVPFLVHEVECIRRTGAQADVFHFRGHANPIRYAAAWLRLRGLLSSGAYDLVHAHWGQSGFVTLPCRLPLVVTFRGSDLQGVVDGRGRYSLKGWILRLISRFVADRADEAIIVSRRLAVHLRGGRQYHVIPSGVDLELFKPCSRELARTQLGFHPNRKLVLFPADPGRPVKCFELARQAVGILKGRSDLPLDLLTLTGIPRALVPVYMNACDVLVLTSHHEGSPNVVKEALACGLPVVSVDVGDVAEQIRGSPGCLIVPRDAEAIAEGLLLVLSQASARTGRGSQGRDQLDGAKTAEKALAVYRRALAGKPPSRLDPRR